MCSECGEDHEPICMYCGDTCWGSCADPDVCRSCWLPKNGGVEMWEEEDDLDACLHDDCRCQCHGEMWEEMGRRYENGVWYDDEDDGPPFVRKGVFPFLKLPGEIRDRIYGFAFLQDGESRSSSVVNGNHRGAIHTALLSTCRQIYKEASKLPLTLNMLDFRSSENALYFLGFQLAISQRSLVTSFHVELYGMEFHSPSWARLFSQLPNLKLSHLGLTVKGPCAKELFLTHTCFTNKLTSAVKSLKTFDITIGSSKITKADKEEIQEHLRTLLVEEYKCTELSQSPKKRSATNDDLEREPAKKAKIAVTPVFIPPSTSICLS